MTITEINEIVEDNRKYPCKWKHYMFRDKLLTLKDFNMSTGCFMFYIDEHSWFNFRPDEIYKLSKLEHTGTKLWKLLNE